MKTAVNGRHKNNPNFYKNKVKIMEKSSHGKRRMPANLCSCVDDKTSTLHMEFTMPGIRKEDIHLKLRGDSFNLVAEKDEVEYVSTGRFCCPVEIDHTEAKYENGLLLVNIPLKDRWKDAIEVSIH